MTLAELIERHHAAQPAPAASAITPKGLAVLAVYQIRRALLDMPEADRADVLALLAELVPVPVAAN